MQDQIQANRRASMTRAQRLKRVFSIDIETCREYGGTFKMIACLEDPVVIKKKMLDHLKEQAEAIVHTLLPESRAPPPRLQKRLFD
ncbi:MAG: hypothetical protein GY753_07430 [Gammaproteobacteria bacterium]|nr:hypothetical protein [Gammaproteobacteria bacterium]